MSVSWLALWPGLDAVHRRLSRFYRSAPEELVSEIAGRFTTGIARLDRSRVRRIAATLIRNVERDIRARPSPIPADEPMEEAAPLSVLGLPDGVDPELATELLGERLRAWIGDDADIVLAIAVGGETSDEVAARLGTTASAVRKRYRRALTRLGPRGKNNSGPRVSQSAAESRFYRVGAGFTGRAKTACYDLQCP